MLCKQSGFVAQNYLWRGEATDAGLPEQVEFAFSSWRVH